MLFGLLYKVRFICYKLLYIFVLEYNDNNLNIKLSVIVLFSIEIILLL